MWTAISLHLWKQVPRKQCYAGPVRTLWRQPVQGPYRFGGGRCSGPTWVYRRGLIWLSVFSCNLKKKDPNKFTFLIVSKKEQWV